MKKFLLIASIFIIMTFVSLSGCEEIEEKPNYKYVTVYVRANVGDSTGDVKVPNMDIEVEILKGGALKRAETLTTNEAGTHVSLTHTVQLYKDQPVKVIGNINQPLPEEFLNQGYSLNPHAEFVLDWKTVDSAVDWGETYPWDTFLYFEISK